MKKDIIGLLEIACALITGFLAFFWIQDPNGSFEPWVVFVGVITTCLEIMRRLLPEKELVKLHMDLNNSTYCKFYSQHSKDNGFMSLLLYGIQLENRSNKTLVVKDISIEYGLFGKQFVRQVRSLITSKIGEEQKDSIVLHTPPSFLVLLNWKNINLTLANNSGLKPNEVVYGSCFFTLASMTEDSLKYLTDLKLKITFFSGNFITQPIDVGIESYRRFRGPYVVHSKFEIQDHKVYYLPNKQ